MKTFTSPKPRGTPTWVDMMSTDPAASRAFYQSLFGWHYDISGPEYGGYATANAGKHTAGGIGGQMPGSPPMPSTWQLYFASNDLKADVAAASKLGATVLAEPMEIGPFGAFAVLADPTGGAFALWKAGEHIGATIINAHGAMTWHELYSPDAKKARDFYGAFLGATVRDMPGGMEYYTLFHGNDMLAGIMQIAPEWGPMPAHWATYWEVANIDAAVAAAVKLGGTQMGNIDNSPFGRIAALKDNTGAMFKLHQANPR
jgi:hypothetical protein